MRLQIVVVVAQIVIVKIIVAIMVMMPMIKTGVVVVVVGINDMLGSFSGLGMKKVLVASTTFELQVCSTFVLILVVMAVRVRV